MRMATQDHPYAALPCRGMWFVAFVTMFWKWNKLMDRREMAHCFPKMNDLANWNAAAINADGHTGPSLRGSAVPWDMVCGVCHWAPRKKQNPHHLQSINLPICGLDVYVGMVLCGHPWSVWIFRTPLWNRTPIMNGMALKKQRFSPIMNHIRMHQPWINQSIQWIVNKSGIWQIEMARQ